jgi:starch synthase
VDVHVTFPHYRRAFQPELAACLAAELEVLRQALPPSRIHPAQDRAFYCQDDALPAADAVRLSLAFQREVLARIVPPLSPCVLHGMDWMTGLLPAAARAAGLPSVFTAHHLHTRAFRLDALEHAGWDPSPFWRGLYYAAMPGDYRETRQAIPIDPLVSGLFAADFVVLPSPTFLGETAGGQHPHVSDAVRRELERKQVSAAAAGVLCPPDASFDPVADPALPFPYDADDASDGKRRNKAELQRALGLADDPSAALLFWPTPPAPDHDGSALLARLLPDLAGSAAPCPVQLVIAAHGARRKTFRDEVRHHGLERSVAVSDASPALSRLAYAASDFTLVPSRCEPSGLAAMTALRYGSLPVALDTGANHDVVRPLDAGRDSGNGFVFRDYDSAGLRWAIDQALSFFGLAPEIRAATLARVMRESRRVLTLEACARRYATLYGAAAGVRGTPP